MSVCICAFQYIIVFRELSINGIFISENAVLINVSCIIRKSQVAGCEGKKGIYQGSPKIQALNGGKGLESTRQWMKPEDPGPVMNSQLPVIKEKQPWELGIICL